MRALGEYGGLFDLVRSAGRAGLDPLQLGHDFDTLDHAAENRVLAVEVAVPSFQNNNDHETAQTNATSETTRAGPSQDEAIADHDGRSARRSLLPRAGWRDYRHRSVIVVLVRYMTSIEEQRIAEHYLVTDHVAEWRQIFFGDPDLLCEAAG